MAVLLDDTFTRADSTTSPGSPTTGGPYTAVAGTWGISSNRLYVASGVSINLLTFPAAANLTLSCTLVTTGFSAVGLVFRYSDSSNYWFFGSANSTSAAALWRNKGGTLTQVTSTLPWVEGQSVQVSAYGNYIYLYTNGVLRMVVDSFYLNTATTAGLFTNTSTSAPRFDNLNAVDLAGVPGGIDGSSNIHVYKGRDLSTDDTGSAA